MPETADPSTIIVPSRSVVASSENENIILKMDLSDNEHSIKDELSYRSDDQSHEDNLMEDRNIENTISTSTTTTTTTSGNSSGKATYHRHPKPPLSYIALIAAAIQESPTRKLTLAEINDYLMKKYPFFRGSYTGWRNSVRHNLSLNECFTKVLRDPSRPWGKDNYWTINCNSEYTFADGVFRRRRKRINRKKSKKSKEIGLTGHHIAVAGEKKFNSPFAIDNILGKSSDDETHLLHTVAVSAPSHWHNGFSTVNGIEHQRLILQQQQQQHLYERKLLGYPVPSTGLHAFSPVAVAATAHHAIIPAYYQSLLQSGYRYPAMEALQQHVRAHSHISGTTHQLHSHQATQASVAVKPSTAAIVYSTMMPEDLRVSSRHQRDGASSQTRRAEPSLRQSTSSFSVENLIS
ncbi:forkhead box protein I1c [Saccoglossus kowalevskii]|uniref:Forkhead box protein I1c n=2 Tax=Saccoglossus kowalevskii TaxID=10224 RepID=A0ABM0GM75_SACKO|nr:PREDICTED: forkhead box protein I1c [Saccoglossus kowalevskii]